MSDEVERCFVCKHTTGAHATTDGHCAMFGCACRQPQASGSGVPEAARAAAMQAAESAWQEHFLADGLSTRREALAVALAAAGPHLVAAAVAEERATTGQRIEAAKAAYEGKIQDLAVETLVNSAVTQWATRHSPSWNGDLADVGVDRGRQIAKRECLEVLLAAREAALADLRAALASPGEQS